MYQTLPRAMTSAHVRASVRLLVTVILVLACNFLGQRGPIEGVNAQFGFPGAFPSPYMSGPSFSRPVMSPPFQPVRRPLFSPLSNDNLHPPNWFSGPILRTPYTYNQPTYGYYNAPKPASPARQCRSSGACKEIDHGTTLATTWKMETTTVPTTIPTTFRPMTTTMAPAGSLRTVTEQPIRNPTTRVRFYASERSDNGDAMMNESPDANVTSVTMTPRR